MQDMHTSTSDHFHQTDTSWLRSTTPGDACSLPRAAPAPVAPSQMLSLSPLTSTASAWSENRVAPAKNTCHLLIASRGPCAVDLPSAILFFTSLLLWYFCFRSMWPWNGMACSCARELEKTPGLHDGLADTDSWKIILNVFAWARRYDFFNGARSNNCFTITW